MQKTIIICDSCNKEITEEERKSGYFGMRAFDTCENCYEKLKNVKKRFEEMQENLVKEQEKILQEELEGIYLSYKLKRIRGRIWNEIQSNL